MCDRQLLAVEICLSDGTAADRNYQSRRVAGLKTDYMRCVHYQQVPRQVLQQVLQQVLTCLWCGTFGEISRLAQHHPAYAPVNDPDTLLSY